MKLAMGDVIFDGNEFFIANRYNQIFNKFQALKCFFLF